MCDKIPPDIPIQFTLTDPNNITQTFVTKTKMNNGYFEYVFPSLDMVGYWKVNVKFNENEAYKKSDTVEF
ncbi:hypothetical protein MHK_005254 [Candidatus Magnetomorum sp. HK-1]|nr:hypothetical protein MHK_005254 [Candidatus Magnetomorum sp. HK-1]